MWGKPMHINKQTSVLHVIIAMNLILMQTALCLINTSDRSAR